MKTIELENYKTFVNKAAARYSTAVQQVKDIAEELGCTIFCQRRKLYNESYNYMLISREDEEKIMQELEARKDNLQPSKQSKKCSCKADKIEWLMDQGAEVDVTDKANIYIVSMYDGAIAKKFNLNCGMQNVQEYFARCFEKHSFDAKEETETVPAVKPVAKITTKTSSAPAVKPVKLQTSLSDRYVPLDVYETDKLAVSSAESPTAKASYSMLDTIEIAELREMFCKH